MGVLGPDGQPNGMLMDIGALQADADRKPASLANPLSISRVQSAYRAADAISGTLIITFTVTNNQSPSVAPQLPVSATITDTIAAVSAMDFSKDPNVIRNVLVADSLSNYAAFVGSVPMPDHAVSQYAWNLGDIPPLSSVTATLMLHVPTTTVDFIDLDTGATAWGTLQGRMVSTQARPASLAPDAISGEPIGDWLKWTVDADKYDQYMLNKAAELSQDPIRMFEYVRSLGYESYKGSLRGTRGTLWSEAGNSLDQASLLIAMLRASGVPSRYRHGVLSDARAQELILSMFPKPTSVIGHVLPGTQVSDPANDPKLLAETQDHWWVEAYLPGLGWRDLDPSFRSAIIGQRFVADSNIATDGTDRIAEVLDAMRHKATITVKIENYHPLNVGNSGLSYAYPLTHTFNTVELVGNPVTLGHLVNTESQSGMIFYWVRHTYVPYLTMGNFEMPFEGEPFQDMISNFPFGTSLTTGEWLIFDVHDVDGNVETYEREIADSIGFKNREQGGTISVAADRGLNSLVTDLDRFTVFLAPSKVPSGAMNEPGGKGLLVELRERVQALEQIKATSMISNYVPSNINSLLFPVLVGINHTNGLLHLMQSDSQTTMLDSYLLTKSYPVTPRIIIASFTVHPRGEDAETRISLDLLKNDIRVVASPGQSHQSLFTQRLIRGVAESVIEGRVLSKTLGGPSLSTAGILEEAARQGIPTETWGPGDLDKLAAWDVSEQGRARIHAALSQRGLLVVVPTARVPIGDATYIAWWEINPKTGETVGVLENGQHGLIGYVQIILNSIKTWARNHAFIAGLTAGLLAGVAGALSYAAVLAAGGSRESAKLVWGAVSITLMGLMTNTAALWFPDPVAIVMFQNGLVIAGGVLSIVIVSCPPIPDIFLSISPGVIHSTVAQSRVPGHFITHPSAAVEGSLVSPFAGFTSTIQADWSLIAQNVFQSVDLSTDKAALYDSMETLIDVGSIRAIPLFSTTTTLAQDSPLKVAISGTGTGSFYAPATSGLGAGSNWITYTAQLTSTQPYTLELSDAVVTVNGTDTYTGSFTLVTTDTTYIEGSGHTAVPNFADAAYMQTSDAHLMIGPATGTFLVGGESVDASNGLALAGYTGPITISEETPTLDRIELNGDASFFTLATVPTTTATNPNTPVNFRAQISANFTDTYTTTVEAPEGWNVELDATGAITATPPLGTEPGDYTILVTAQSGAYPDLFASAVHTVTTTAYQGMAMQVNPDTLITVPFGPADPSALPGDTNNGQMQIPGAAFTIDITNTSTTSHTFAIDVSGLPSGWLILSGAEGQTSTTLELPAGGVGQIGLYISPTLTTLPPAGTEYPFNVNATAIDNPSLSQSDADVFTVPAIAFSQVKAEPAVVYTSPGLTTTFDLGLRNVGNASGSFPLIVTQPISTWTATINSPVALDAGQALTQSVVLNTPDGEIGRDYNVSIASPSGAYTQTAKVNVRVVGPCVVKVDQAARLTERVASGEESAGLIAAWDNLTLQLSEFETKPGDAMWRNRAIEATRTVIDQLKRDRRIATTDLQLIIDDLANNATAAEDSVSIAAYCTSTETVMEQLTRLAARNVAMIVDPGATATLPGLPVTYTVRLINRGTLATTYDLSLQDINAAWLSQSAGSVALTPGEEAAWSFTVTPDVLGTYPFMVTVVAQEDSLVRYQTRAALRVVDAFIRVTEVTADPAFVEVGNNTVQLYASVANIANLYQPGMAHVSIAAPDAHEVFSTTTPITVVSGLRWTSYSLGQANVSGWTKGVYSITVQIVDVNGNPIRDGLGTGSLVVGEGVIASSSVVPQIVAPGTVTATTIITTERTVGAGGAPIEGLNNVYTFYLTADEWHGDNYDGFYIVGLRPATQYQVQRFDEPTRNWIAVVTDTVTMDDIKLHFGGYPPDRLYRVYAENPVLIVVTSGEGSLVSAATPDLKFRGRHFTFLGDYSSVLGVSRATIFALENSTTVTVEVKPFAGTWGAPTTRVLQAGSYWFSDRSTSGTTVMRVISDKDVIVYRNSTDNDELDTVIADNGTPYGTTFYFAPVPHASTDVFLLYNTEPVTANVTIYDIDSPASPAVAWQGTVSPLGARSASPSRGSYFKVVSDRTLSANGGGAIDAQLGPGNTFADAVWEIMGAPTGNRYVYQTNLLYSRNLALVKEYNEFESGLRGETNIETEIPLIDKSTDNLWNSNDVSYLASAPVTLTIEVFSHTVPAGLNRHEENYDVKYTPRRVMKKSPSFLGKLSRAGQRGCHSQTELDLRRARHVGTP